MEAVEIEKMVKAAAAEAVKEFRRSEMKNKRVKIFQNTKKLMENYNRICESVQEGISDLTEVETDVDISEVAVGVSEEDIFINSIVKSKLRSVVMLAHIDKCLKLLEAEEYRKNTPEKYLAFTYFYLDGMTYDSIAEVYGYGERTARRWITELTNILSIYLFGADAIMLD